MGWTIVNFALVAVIVLMLFTARQGIFPRSMVLRDPADSKLAATFSKVINWGSVGILLVAVLARGEYPAVITGILALWVALDVGYYIWICHRNV